jgi:hypothetical protein
MRQAKHSRSSRSGPGGRRAKSRRRTAGMRAGSIKELAREAWSGVESGESEAGSSGSRRSPRPKEIH